MRKLKMVALEHLAMDNSICIYEYIKLREGNSAYTMKEHLKDRYRMMDNREFQEMHAMQRTYALCTARR